MVTVLKRAINAILNPFLGVSISGWSASNASTTRVDNTAAYGQFAARATKTNTIAASLNYAGALQVKPSTVYDVVALVSASYDCTMTVYARPNASTVGQVVIGTIDLVAGVRQVFVGAFDSAQLAYPLGLTFLTPAAAVGQWLEVTGLTLVERADATPFWACAGNAVPFMFDGSTVPAFVGTLAPFSLPGMVSTWRGTVDASPSLLEWTYDPTGLPPNDELVAMAWLAQRVPQLAANQIATTLPKDPTAWAAGGFVQVQAIPGGQVDIDTHTRRPVVQVDCWAVTPGSNKPPWGVAMALGEYVRVATEDSQAFGALVALPGLFTAARVQSVYLFSEPTRVPGDPSGYARVTLDLVVEWVRA